MVTRGPDSTIQRPIDGSAATRKPLFWMVANAINRSENIDET
jgi:hypothetical protein